MGFFSFSILEILLHRLLACFLFDKKLMLIFTFDLQKIISSFLYAFKVFFLCLVFTDLTMNCLGVTAFLLITGHIFLILHMSSNFVEILDFYCLL